MPLQSLLMPLLNGSTSLFGLTAEESSAKICWFAQVQNEKVEKLLGVYRLPSLNYEDASQQLQR